MVFATPKEKVLCRFGLKTGIDFAQFSLYLGMVYEGTTVTIEYECVRPFNSK